MSPNHDHHGKQKKHKWEKFRYLLNTETLSEGDRKLKLAVYFAHLILLVGAIFVLLYISMRTYLSYQNAEVVSFLEMLANFILLGLGGSLSIYSAGNVFAWKMRGGGMGGMGGGIGSVDGIGNEQTIAAGGDIINLRVGGQKGQPGVAAPPDDLPRAGGAVTPPGLPPLPVKPKT